MKLGRLIDCSDKPIINLWPFRRHVYHQRERASTAMRNGKQKQSRKSCTVLFLLRLVDRMKKYKYDQSSGGGNSSSSRGSAHALLLFYFDLWSRFNLIGECSASLAARGNCKRCCSDAVAIYCCVLRQICSISTNKCEHAMFYSSNESQKIWHRCARPHLWQRLTTKQQTKRKLWFFFSLSLSLSTRCETNGQKHCCDTKRLAVVVVAASHNYSLAGPDVPRWSIS